MHGDLQCGKKLPKDFAKITAEMLTEKHKFCGGLLLSSHRRRVGSAADVRPLLSAVRAYGLRDRGLALIGSPAFGLPRPHSGAFSFLRP